MQKYNTCKSVILISYNLIFRHWQSISLRCQPCRFAYDFILDIQAAAEDSEYVFSQLNFKTGLPSFHSSSKNGSSTKPLEDYYKNIPKALIKKLYAKYFLDFVLLGFSPDSVQSIVNAGTDEPSDYSFETFSGFNSSIFSQSRKVISLIFMRDHNDFEILKSLLNPYWRISGT